VLLTSKSQSKLTFEQIDLAAAFSDAAYDYPKLSFNQVAKNVVPRGFGKGPAAKQFTKDAREIFNQERAK
jgi:hypothetical protein